MPIYEYSCEACEHHFETLQKMSDDPLVECPNCKAPKLKKLISAAAFRLKGGGWYETDFKKDNKLLKPVVVAVNGELVDVAKIGQIAALPNKDQAISMMMAVMKLPIEKFVRTLSAPNVKLVQTLSAYKSKLEQN